MSPSWGLEDLAVYVTACALLLPSPPLRVESICLTAKAARRRDEHHSVSAAERRLLRAAGAGPVQLADVPQPWRPRKARKRRPHRQLAAGQRECSAKTPAVFVRPFSQTLHSHSGFTAACGCDGSLLPLVLISLTVYLPDESLLSTGPGRDAGRPQSLRH